jgi:hypothetical protein
MRRSSAPGECKAERSIDESADEASSIGWTASRNAKISIGKTEKQELPVSVSGIDQRGSGR